MSGASDALRREIEDFLALEARLADESDYARWEALVTDDMHYWVPKGRADYDPATGLSYINDNRARLGTRIRQLQSGLRRAQTPPSSLRRVLGLVEILRVDDAAGEYEVAANFVLYEHTLQATGALRLWPGRATWTLRRVDGALRIRRKVVELVTAADAQPNLAFIL